MGIQRIRHEVHKPAPYTPKTTSGDTNTKFSETPRTLHGVDAAFKGARYGNWVEHYSAPGKYLRWFWLVGFVILIALTAAVLIIKT